MDVNYLSSWSRKLDREKDPFQCTVYTLHIY